MLAIIIPTYNAERFLSSCLLACESGKLHGLVKEIIISDADSTDDTVVMAESMGLRVITTGKGRGLQYRVGVENTISDWLLFLHVDTVLPYNWDQYVYQFIQENINLKKRKHWRNYQAGCFRLSFDTDCWQARLLAWLVHLRFILFRLPYGDQGLLLHRESYHLVGGYRDMPLMEDVDMIHRLKRHKIQVICSPLYVKTSAQRYEKDGYMKRCIINQCCLWLYFLGVSVKYIKRIYE